MAKTSHNQTGVQQLMSVAQANSTGEAVPHQAQQTDAISEQRKHGHESTEDIPPAPQSAEKKSCKMKKAPKKASAKQSKQKAAEVKVANEGKKHWTNWKMLELHKELGANSRHAYRKVSQQKFSGKRSPESVRSRYEQLQKLFTYILAFESMTGNGKGDPDVKELDEQIKNVRAAGKDGWYELFNNCLGKHPGLVWEHDFHSGTISDTIEISSDKGAGSGGFKSTYAEEKPARKKGDRASTKGKERHPQKVFLHHVINRSHLIQAWAVSLQITLH
ncbi:hypothetical protein BD769DRAFT_1668436 [Suillus cothurnatus]|nr:hypothetical protein BD769DRAFT_1668436 [Suillus cothurnatus]